MSDKNLQTQEPKLLHPLTILYRALKAFPQFLPLAFILLYQRSGRISLDIVFELLLIFGISVPYFLLWYLFYRYEITAEKIIIRWGILSRHERSVPFEKIQNIHIKRDILHRLLGLASVEIETAGAATVEIALNAVHYKEAFELQQFLLERRVQKQPIQTPEEQKQHEGEEITISNALLFMRGFTQPRLILLGVLAVYLQFYLYISSVGEFAPETNILTIIEEFFQDPLRYPPMYTAAIFLTLILGNQILSALLNLFTYGNFSLRILPEQFIVQHGLFTRRTTTIPVKKIQQFHLSTNFLLRRFGYYSLQCATAGLQAGERKLHTLFSIAPASEIARFLHLHFDIQIPDNFSSVHPYYFIRNAGISTALSVATVAVLYSTTGYGLWILWLLPLLGYRAYLHYKHFGFTFTEKHIFIRTGILIQECRILPTEKIQSCVLKESIPQRQLGIATVKIETAAALASVHEVPSLSHTHIKTVLFLIRPQFRQMRGGDSFQKIVIA